jgi:hypothetical protein
VNLELGQGVANAVFLLGSPISFLKLIEQLLNAIMIFYQDGDRVIFWQKQLLEHEFSLSTHR